MRKIAWLIIPIGILGLLAFVILAARPAANSTAFTLKAGDCFDIPGDTQIGDIATINCGRQHDAEVFVTGKLNEADPTVEGATVAPSSLVEAYPGASAIATWVGTFCAPSIINAYTGQASSTALAVGYFFPDETAWGRGERQITCYLHSRDGSPLTNTLRDPKARPTD